MSAIFSAGKHFLNYLFYSNQSSNIQDKVKTTFRNITESVVAGCRDGAYRLRVGIGPISQPKSCQAFLQNMEVGQSGFFAVTGIERTKTRERR
jgi:hypothetical protein